MEELGRTWVTGATGMVGRQLTQELVEQGLPVTALVRPQSWGRAQAELQGADLVRGSLPDELEELTEAPAPRVIFHCAAQMERLHRRDSARAAVRAEVDGVRRIARLAGERGARLVYVSSSSAITDVGYLGPISETAPCAPVGAYAEAKQAAERFLLEQAPRDLDVVILRAPIVYGELASWGVPLRLARRIWRRWPPLIGPGHNRVSLCYVGNLTAALRFMASQDDVAQRLFHVDDGACVSLRELTMILSRALGRRPLVRSVPMPLARLVVGGVRSLWRFTGQGEPPVWTALRLYSLRLELDTQRIEQLGFERAVPQVAALERSARAWQRRGLLSVR